MLTQFVHLAVQSFDLLAHFTHRRVDLFVRRMRALITLHLFDVIPDSLGNFVKPGAGEVFGRDVQMLEPFPCHSSIVIRSRRMIGSVTVANDRTEFSFGLLNLASNIRDMFGGSTLVIESFVLVL